MMSLRAYLKQIEASCDTCLRGWFVVPRRDVVALGVLCSNKIPPLDRDRKTALLRRRFNRLAHIVEVLALSDTDLNVIQPKIKALRAIAEMLRRALRDDP